MPNLTFRGLYNENTTFSINFPISSSARKQDQTMRQDHQLLVTSSPATFLAPPMQQVLTDGLTTCPQTSDIYHFMAHTHMKGILGIDSPLLNH